MLFGHEKGAFTGADRQTKGVFEEANGGIVYFDELANMPMEIQAKLLRVLQEKEITRLGSTKTIQLDFRVVCATNRNLEEMVSERPFQRGFVSTPERASDHASGAARADRRHSSAGRALS